MTRQYITLGIVVVVALLAPAFGTHYTNFLYATVLIYSLIALSLNVLIGIGGQISIGHAGFWALGAYASGLLVTKVGAPFLVGVIGGGVVALIAGLLVAMPALRVQGHYLAIATLGFALVIQQILFEWESLTGGRQGLFVPRPELFGYELTDDRTYVYALLVIVAVAMWLVQNFRTSRTGKALMALKMSPIAAQCAGISRARHIIIAFAFSAFLTGVSGALYAHLIGYLSTDTFTLQVSLSFLTMAVIGGLGSLVGAFLGAAYLTLAPEVFREFSDGQMVMYGVTLVLCMIFLPGGLASIPGRVKAALSKARSKRSALPVVDTTTERTGGQT